MSEQEPLNEKRFCPYYESSCEDERKGMCLAEEGKSGICGKIRREDKQAEES